MNKIQLISILIPCRNERKHIERTLRAVLASDYENFEIIVVDGLSDDGTRDILQSLMMQDPRVKMVDNPSKLAGQSLNIGLVHSRGEYILVLGSRHLLAPNYISLLIKGFNARSDAVCVGGNGRHGADSPAAEVIARAMESGFSVGLDESRAARIDCYVDSVAVPMYRASIFREVGTFDERLTSIQVDEFNYRIREKGLKIFYVHNAKVTLQVSGSLKKAFRLYHRYGYYKVLLDRLHGLVSSPRHALPAAFIAFWVVMIPWSGLLPGLRPIAGFAALLYLFTGLVMAGRKLGFVQRFQVLWTCIVLHVGFGLGYWKGLYEFKLKKHDPDMETT